MVRRIKQWYANLVVVPIFLCFSFAEGVSTSSFCDVVLVMDKRKRANHLSENFENVHTYCYNNPSELAATPNIH